MEIVFWSVTAVLAALGLIELVRMLVFRLTRPLRPGAITLVLSIEDGEECEQLIRAGVSRLQWMGWGPCRLVCVNKRQDPQVEGICKVLERRYPQLTLCKTQDLVYHILQSDQAD